MSVKTARTGIVSVVCIVVGNMAISVPVPRASSCVSIALADCRVARMPQAFNSHSNTWRVKGNQSSMSGGPK
jgi:hypothetical protein